jgi:predicted ester cyclase
VSAAENKTIVRRVKEEATNRRNFSIFDELLSPEFVDHEAGPNSSGPEGEKELLSTVADAFPDWRWDIEDMVAEGDKVVTRYVARGTHRGEFMGASPTGEEVAVTGINVVRLEGEKIVESWGNSDQLAMLRQIGMVPAEVSFRGWTSENGTSRHLGE